MAPGKSVLELSWRHGLGQTQRSDRHCASSHSARSYHLDFQSTSQSHQPLSEKDPSTLSLGISSSFYFARLHDNSGIDKKDLYCYKTVIFFLDGFTMFKSAARLRWTDSRRLTPHFLSHFLPFTRLPPARCSPFSSTFFSLDLSDHWGRMVPIWLMKAEKPAQEQRLRVLREGLNTPPARRGDPGLAQAGRSDQAPRASRSLPGDRRAKLGQN